MKEKYGVQIVTSTGRIGSDSLLAHRIVWYDTLEEAIKNANGEPIIKSVAYEVKERE